MRFSERAPEVTTRPSITIGGREATLAGNSKLVSAGLYRFDVTIPDLEDGDHAVVAEVGGGKSSPNVFLSVQR